MVVTPAYAQATGGGGGDILVSIMPFVLIFVIVYFLIIRPQRQQMKKRQEMLNNVRRGDQVVTGGGITGKVTKVIDDAEVEVEIAERLPGARGAVHARRRQGEGRTGQGSGQQQIGRKWRPFMKLPPKPDLPPMGGYV